MYLDQELTESAEGSFFGADIGFDPTPIQTLNDRIEAITTLSHKWSTLGKVRVHRGRLATGSYSGSNPEVGAAMQHDLS